MAKIVIPGYQRIVTTPPREFQITKGELVMILTGRQTEDFRLGVFRKFLPKPAGSRELPAIVLDKAFTLGPCETLGGIIVPEISLIKAHPGEELTYSVRPCMELYLGKERIIKALERKPLYEGHADWISRLEKPYLR